MANLVQEIQNDIFNPQISLSDVLRKAKILASRLKDEEFKNWIVFELDGYRNAEELPEYRQVATGNMGDFANAAWQNKNAAVPISALPDDLQTFVTCPFPIVDGIRWIESRAKSGEDTCYHWPQEMIQMLSNYLDGGYHCMSAWRPVSAAQMEQILDAVQSKLLDFVLELEERHPEIVQSMEAISNIPKEEVRNIFEMKITGGVHGSNVAVGGSSIENSSANINEGVTGSEIAQLLQQVRHDVQSLEDDERHKAEVFIEAIEAETVPGNNETRKAMVFASSLLPLLEKADTALDVIQKFKATFDL